MKKRLLAMAVAVYMVAGMLPVSALSVDCEHHLSHTTECGYQEAVAGADCGHTCGEDCATEAGCIHGGDHNKACGYTAAVEGAACKFVCSTCGGTAPTGEDGGEDTDGSTAPTCTGGMDCTLAVGHNDGCEKAAQDAALADCTKAADCAASVHHADCARGEQAEALAECGLADPCEAAVHKQTCSLYIWPCDGTKDCKATDHAETCPAPLWAQFVGLLAELPAPETVDIRDEASLERIHGQIAAIVQFALDNQLYATQDEVTTHPTIATLLEAMAPTQTTGYDWYYSPKDEEGKSVYEISSIAQLQELALITQGKAKQEDGTDIAKDSFSGDIVRLTVDLNFTDDHGYWYDNSVSPNVDYRIQDFAGTFDGNFHTISGLKFNSTKTNQSSIGLFHKITGSVMDLTLDGVTASFADGNQFGLLSANLTGGKVSNCCVKNVTLTSSRRVYGSGVMFGEVTEGASVTGCKVEGVTGTWSGNDNTDRVGMLIGATNGKSAETPVTVSNNSVSGVTLTFSCKTKHFGIFVGKSDYTNVTNCHVSDVNVTTQDYSYNTGGFVGFAGTGSVYNGCSVTGFKMTDKCSGQYNYSGNIGGFAGYVNGTDVSFTNCSATGLDFDLEFANDYDCGVGGFAGKMSSAATVTGCTASGEITATGGNSDIPVGGFIGESAGGLVVEDCDTSVKVTAPDTAGGFIGACNGGSDTYKDCQATGSVTSTGGMAGGMVGYVAESSTPAFDEDCVPSSSIAGPVASEVANSPDKVYSIDNNDHIVVNAAPTYVCKGKIGGYSIGFTSIQAALDAGATEVTLLQNVSENLTLGHDLTLNLGEFTLTSTITIPDGTFTVPEGHDNNKNPDDINGIQVTVTGASTGNNIILTEPELDHHAFQGWCSSMTGEANSGELAVAGGWQAEPGNTYHTHWKHSSYEHLPHDQLHLTFQMNFGDTSFTPQFVEFKPSDDGTEHEIISVEQGDYFTVTYEGLVVELTPKLEAVSRLSVNEEGYTDVIHVIVEDGSVHSITAKLEITRSGSTTQPSEEGAFTGVYGDNMTLSVRVAVSPKTRSTGQNIVTFTYGNTVLGEAEVEFDNTNTTGIASILYDTTSGVIPVGQNNAVAVEYSGGVNLLESEGTIYVTLKKKPLTLEGLAPVDREYDGTADVAFTGGILNGLEFSTDDVAVASITASMADASVGENKPVTITDITLTGTESIWYDITIPAGLTVTITKNVIAAGETETIGGIAVTGPATWDENGAAVTKDGTVTADDETFTVTSGTVKVKDDGTAEVPAGAKVTNEAGDVITGPATIHSDGSVIVGTGGSIQDGDTTIEVTKGSVILETDGTVDIPDDSTVILGDKQITGPAEIDADGNVTTGAGGSIRIIYKVTAGANQTVTKGSAASFTVNMNYGKFKDVLVNGTALSQTHYTHSSGSTIITLNAAYIESLTSGQTYTLTVLGTDGEASTTFTVKAASTLYVYSEETLLQTGMEILPIGLMAFGGISLLAASMWLLRKKSYGR